MSPYNDAYADLKSFTLGRYLQSVILCDDQLGRNFARVIFNTLLDASDNISMLDLSENDVSGLISITFYSGSLSVLMLFVKT